MVAKAAHIRGLLVRRVYASASAPTALLARQTDIDKDHILTDLHNITKFDKHAALLKTETVPVGGYDTQPPVFGVA